MKNMCKSFAGNISLTLADSNGDVVETTLSQNFEVGHFQHKISHEKFWMNSMGQKVTCVFLVSVTAFY